MDEVLFDELIYFYFLKFLHHTNKWKWNTDKERVLRSWYESDSTKFAPLLCLSWQSYATRSWTLYLSWILLRSRADSHWWHRTEEEHQQYWSSLKKGPRMTSSILCFTNVTLMVDGTTLAAGFLLIKYSITTRRGERDEREEWVIGIPRKRWPILPSLHFFFFF